MQPCKACGRVNAPEAKYCMTCGTPLGATATAPATDGPPGARTWANPDPGAPPGPTDPEAEEEAPDAAYAPPPPAEPFGTGSRSRRPWGRASTSGAGDQEPGAQASASSGQPGGKGQFEKVMPFVEDFAFDVVRAGARLYFGMKDPRPPVTGYGQDKPEPDLRERFERLKDVIAEARVESRRRGRPGSDGDRTPR